MHGIGRRSRVKNLTPALFGGEEPVDETKKARRNRKLAKNQKRPDDVEGALFLADELGQVKEQKIHGEYIPRPYQRAAHAGIVSSLAEGSGAMLIMATGTGKTPVGADFCRTFLQWGEGDVLWIAHREELIWQAQNSIEAVVRMPVGMESAFSRAGNERLVVASKDSIWKKDRLGALGKERFGLIVCDECHRSPSSNVTYETIFDYYAGARRLGLTAAADRTDRLSLSKRYPSIAYRYDVKEAVDDSFLCPIIQKYAWVESSEIKILNPKAAGEAELTEIVMEEKPLHGVAGAAIEFSKFEFPGRRQGIIFAPSTAAAERIAEILNRNHALYGTGPAAVLTEKTKREHRRAVLDLYTAGEIQFIANYGILTEGVDLPTTALVVIARACHSRALITQMIGRGTRLHPAFVEAINRATSERERRQIIANSLKPNCLVIDLAGITGTHKLVTAADVLAGNYDYGIRERAKAILLEKQGGDVNEAVNEAISDAANQQAIDKRSGIVSENTYGTVKIDPFDILDVFPTREPPWLKGKKASEAQQEVLVRAGFERREAKEMSLHRAKAMIDRIIQRRNQGLCTVAQARILKKHGFDVNTTFVDARLLIDQIAANGWRVDDNHGSEV